MVANKPFKTLLSNASSVEEELPKQMVIGYATRIPDIQTAVTGTIAAGILDALALLVSLAMAVLIR